MLFTTSTQWAAVAVALFAGWLFGLASHPGGRRWKQRYADEREVHAASRKQFDGRLAENNARIAELERENAQLAKAQPVTPAVVRERPVVVRERPVGQRGWFDWSTRAR